MGASVLRKDFIEMRRKAIKNHYIYVISGAYIIEENYCIHIHVQAQLAILAQQAQMFAPFPGFMPGAAPQMPLFDVSKMLPVPNC